MQKFNVTFETITPESAEHGDVESRGFLCEAVGLREALDGLDGLGSYVEADCCPVRSPRWFTAYSVREDYGTGETENRSLHLPDSLTESSRLRIARLLDCYGV